MKLYSVQGKTETFGFFEERRVTQANKEMKNLHHYVMNENVRKREILFREGVFFPCYMHSA